MRTIAHLMVSAGFLLSSGSALAVQHTWNLTGSDKLGSHVAACGSNSNADCQLSFSSDGASLYARAYSTNGSYNSLNGLLIGADLVRYSGSGLGVRNLDEGSSESESPEHATDNRDRFDLIVFEAPTVNFDWDSLGIGWAREEGTSSYRADVQLYVGNGTGKSMDFTTMCLTGCGTDQKNIMDTDSGFKSVGTFNDIAEGSSFNIPGTTNGTANTGRYLVVSGALGGSSFDKRDFFKISSIKGVKGVPEPQTLALFGIGFIAWLGMSRRRQAAHS